jgi:uncharacterized protein YjbJ (UPF0337 family)
MNDLQLASRPQRNVFKIKKNLPTRASDGTIQFSRTGGNINQAAEKIGEDLAVWVEEGVFQASDGLEKPAGDSNEVVGAVAVETLDDTVFEAKWIKLRHKAKGWWSKLSDDDLEKVSGKFDQLIRLLQIKYGYSRRQAEAEYIKRTK